MATGSARIRGDDFCADFCAYGRSHDALIDAALTIGEHLGIRPLLAIPSGGADLEPVLVHGLTKEEAQRAVRADVERGRLHARLAGELDERGIHLG